MPKWILALIVSSTAFALIPLAIAAKARNSHSSEPHIHIFDDMDYQPKYKSDTANAAVRRWPREPRRHPGHRRPRLARGGRPRSTSASPRRGWGVGHRLPGPLPGLAGHRAGPPRQAVRRRCQAARPRPEPLQHLLHPVSRLRRPRPGHGADAGQGDRRRVAGSEPRRPGRHGRQAPERPGVQHDLERIPTDHDGLRRADSRGRPLGDRRLRPRSRAVADRFEPTISESRQVSDELSPRHCTRTRSTRPASSARPCSRPASASRRVHAGPVADPRLGARGLD